MSKYTRELLSEAVTASESMAGVLRYLGLRQAGGTQSYLRRRIKAFGIDTSHFLGQGHMLGKVASNRREAEDILVLLPDGSLRTRRRRLLRAMLESGFKYRCSECGILPEWNGKELVLEIDHEDGNWLNNRRDNLRFLCPNCHSQQVTTNKPHKHRPT